MSTKNLVVLDVVAVVGDGRGMGRGGEGEALQAICRFHSSQRRAGMTFAWPSR